MAGNRRPRVAATCACGERLSAASLDRLNALLERHYKRCPGKRPTR